MPTSPFNDAQIRHVVATLRHIDELLLRATHVDTGIPSSTYTRNTIPQQTDEALVAMRKELHTALETWAPTESLSSGQWRWALQTALRLAQIALAELDAKHLGHYGEVNPSGLDQLATTRVRLADGLEGIRAALERD